MNELVIRNPRGSVEVAQEICKWIEARKREVMAVADGIVVTAENWRDPQTKDALDELEEMVEDLRERGKMLVEDVCDCTEAKRVITAIDSRLWSFKNKADPNCAYAVLASRLKELKAQVAVFKEAATPKAKPRTFVIVLEADDNQFNAVAKAATKAGATVMQFATPQTDKAVAQIRKWFEENM